MLVFNEILFLSLPINLIPAQSSTNPTPTPAKPFPSSNNDNCESFSTASANILIAFAIKIREKADLTISLAPFVFNVFVNELNVRLSSFIMAPIAATDLAISSTFNLEIVLSDAVSMPIAIAILTSDDILIPVVKDSKAP